MDETSDIDYERGNLTNKEKSDKHREEGNDQYEDGKYFAAITSYNKALVYARDDRTRAAMCYGNRSAVYLELKYFDHCLRNIDLAEPYFPVNAKQKLYDRRTECQKIMKMHSDESLHTFKHEFKLSYDANPKIPFFIDALKLRENSEDGKHLITTRDLKAGDVIAVINKPWKNPVPNFMDANYVLGCYTCGDTNNGDLILGKCQGKLKLLFA